MRITLAVAVACLTLGGLAAAGDATAAIRKQVDIPAEGLGPALNALAKDRDFQIVYVTEEIANVRTEGAIGEFTTEEALKKLLTGTGLTYRYLDDKTITVGSAFTPQSRSSHASKTTSSGSDDVNSPQEGKKISSGSFRVAQVDQGKGSSASSVVDQTSNSQENSNGRSNGLSEIIVTAQKKSERLQDVPVPVTAISAQTLADSNLVQIQDYYTMIPGLSVMQDDYGQPQLTIRGLTTGSATSPTVGVVIDDIPYGSSSALAANTQAPEIDPSELAQIEVLRGPQGTLYGANSIGGLLKYVTLAPSTESVTGRIEGGVSGTKSGDGLGDNIRGAINVPLSDTFAVRASGFDRRDPGYIDNPILDIDGINQQTAYGGRLSGLWQPSQAFSVKLSALLQHSDRKGSNDVDILPGLGDLQQDQLRGSGWIVNNIQAYSAIVKAKIGSAELTALTGYSISAVHHSLDYSEYYGVHAEKFFGVGGSEVLLDAVTRKLTEEVRLSIPLGTSVDWLLGVFYNHEHSPSSEDLPAVNTSTGQIVGSIIQIPFPSALTEYAAFTDFTFHITDRFDVQLGGRESQDAQSYQSFDIGPLVGGEIVNPKLSTSNDSFTYLVTPSFKPSKDLMLYARLASGYRPGGPNFNTTTANVPKDYAPDTTKNYEVGVKGDFLDRTFSVDASLYYIDWNNIQLRLFNPSVGNYFANAGRATSRGVELSLQSRPLIGLTIGAWADFSDATLAEAFPTDSTGIGASGDPLPFSSRFSGNFSVEQEFPLATNLTGWVAATTSYVGNREGIFGTTSSPQRQYFPAYARTDLRAGAKFESWTVALFANNMADKRGVLSGGLGTIIPYAFQYIQPRTVGLNVWRAF